MLTAVTAHAVDRPRVALAAIASVLTAGGVAV
jgi:hypothetical protein